MTAALLDVYPETQKLWEDSNPLGRLGKVSPDSDRGWDRSEVEADGFGR